MRSILKTIRMVVSTVVDAVMVPLHESAKKTEVEHRAAMQASFANLRASRKDFESRFGYINGGDRLRQLLSHMESDSQQYRGPLHGKPPVRVFAITFHI
jgi:hypothetical protein